MAEGSGGGGSWRPVLPRRARFAIKSQNQLHHVTSPVFAARATAQSGPELALFTFGICRNKS